MLAIDFEKVSRIYRGGQRLFGKGQKDVTALSGVDLSVEDGEIFGLVGESGSGKSVTGFSIMGLVDAPGRIERLLLVRHLVGEAVLRLEVHVDGAGDDARELSAHLAAYLDTNYAAQRPRQLAVA